MALAYWLPGWKPVRYPVLRAGTDDRCRKNKSGFGGRFYVALRAQLITLYGYVGGFISMFGNRIARQSGQRAWTYLC